MTHAVDYFKLYALRHPSVQFKMDEKLNEMYCWVATAERRGGSTGGAISWEKNLSTCKTS